MISATPFFRWASCSATGLKDAVIVYDLRAYNASPQDFEFSFEHKFYRFGVYPVLLFQNARGQRFFRVAIFDGYDGLQNYRSRVEILVHEMHRATGEFHAVIQGLFLRFESGK